MRYALIVYNAAMPKIIDIFVHLDTYLSTLVASMGSWSYGILFLVIFCETGLVITPFLPGDSLLFAAGALAGLGALDITMLIVTCLAAAIIGDAVNYRMGSTIGMRLFEGPLKRMIKREHLERTRMFFEKHGGKAIVFARFVPIVRTFAPFLAGIGRMEYRRFFMFNITGAVAWVSLFTLGGYFFGNLPIVQEQFHWFIVAIIAASIVPAVWHWWRERYAMNHER